MEIELHPMTRERMHELYRGFAFDPDLFMDMSLFERCKSYAYDAQKVDALFEKRSLDPDSIAFAVMLHGAVIGEVRLQHINDEAKECELSIHLQNDSVKGRGYGTQAERLAVAYAFDQLGMERVLADAIVKNTRSRHILEKLGFRFLREADGFRYYCLDREDRKPDREP